MTPKRKAKSIVDNLYHEAFGASWEPYLKRCAKHHVDEIIDVIKGNSYESDDDNGVKKILD